MKKLLRSIYRKLFRGYIYELELELDNHKTVLDLACGSSSPIKYLSKRFYSIGVDIFEQSVEISRRTGIHNDYLIMDVLDIDRKLKQNSFDCVLALDLIEHLEKKDGIRLLYMMENIAKEKAIVFTPNGFLPQKAQDGNIWQIHRSGWSVEEMRKRGYRVIGINGWKRLRGEKASVRFSPKIFWLIISDVTQLFVRDRPEKAFQILCVKDMK